MLDERGDVEIQVQVQVQQLSCTPEHILIFSISRTPSPMNLNQITLPSIDLAKGVAFYQQLGLELIVDSVPRYARLLCPDGESTLSLHRVEQLPVGEGIVVYFECENLDEQVAKLKAEGILFDLDPVDQQWLWREAHLRDPDGNRLILFHAGENRKDPPWRV